MESLKQRDNLWTWARGWYCCSGVKKPLLVRGRARYTTEFEVTPRASRLAPYASHLTRHALRPFRPFGIRLVHHRNISMGTNPLIFQHRVVDFLSCVFHLRCSYIRATSKAQRSPVGLNPYRIHSTSMIGQIKRVASNIKFLVLDPDKKIFSCGAEH